MKAMRLTTWLAVALLLTSAPAVRAEPVTTFGFTVLPASGAIAGAPGETIGWGYSLVNYSLTDWLVVGFPSTDAFVNATPDASVFDFPILAPNTTVTRAYDPAFNQGLFQITWNDDAPLGSVNEGLFTLSADFYDADLFDGGQFLYSADPQTAAYSATLVAKQVPEPATLVLSGVGLALAGIVRQRRSRSTAR